MRNRSELRLLAYPEPGYKRRLTHLKIAAADAAAPPYFHVRWSRRGAGGPGVKIAIFIARGWPARAMWDYLEKEWAARGPGGQLHSKRYSLPVCTR